MLVSIYRIIQDNAAWLAYVDEHRTTVWEVGVHDTDQTHT